MEPPTDYQADNSRSDLSDILEEEEEDLYSDHLSEAQSRGYTVGINRVKEQSIPHISHISHKICGLMLLLLFFLSFPCIFF